MHPLGAGEIAMLPSMPQQKKEKQSTCGYGGCVTVVVVL